MPFPLAIDHQEGMKIVVSHRPLFGGGALIESGLISVNASGSNTPRSI
jgi:hypothetical protein